MTYDPKKAAKKFTERRFDARRGIAVEKAQREAKPDLGYTIRAKPATLCFPLAAFVEESPALPVDLHTVERSSKGLREHVRPDGGVFIGLFELPNNTATTIVVFGDPLMELAEAKRASIEFRRRLQQILDSAPVAQHNSDSEVKGFAGKPRIEN